MNYENSYDMQIENAYIISLKNNKISEEMTQRCAKSCDKAGQKYKIFYGFDGNTGSINVPDELKNQSWINWLRLKTSILSPTQIACLYSHFALWTKCVEMDRPIIILEHDSIVVKSMNYHPLYNSIVYLGCEEQKNGSPLFPTPPHGSAEKSRYRFICRAHAYSIDPAVAKNLIAYTIKQGIHTTLDVMINCDIFNISQYGFFAYDEPGVSTIHKDWEYLERGL